jgi:hypothetical protein
MSHLLANEEYVDINYEQYVLLFRILRGYHIFNIIIEETIIMSSTRRLSSLHANDHVYLVRQINSYVR